MTSYRFRQQPPGVDFRRSRFFLVRFIVVLLFSLLGARLVYVQGYLRLDLQKKAARQLLKNKTAEPARYKILDRHESTLAETVKVYSCFADPSRIRQPGSVAKRLARALSMSEQGVLARIKKAPGAFVWIKRDVPSPVVAKLKKEDLPGVGFKTEVRRHYPTGPLLSHLLGLVGIDGHGLSGLERVYERVLDQSPEKQTVGEPALLPKGHLRLTIDSHIQQIVEQELEWGVRKTDAKSGMVIVQEPASGEILAMASWPPLSLDPDHPPLPTELRIPPAVDVFEPGSTFKIVALSAALEEKLFSFGSTFDGENGAWRVSGITIHDHEPQKKMTLVEVLAYSSNIGTAKIAERLGSERLYRYAQLFGFGSLPGSDIPGEARGVLRPLSRWSGVSKYTISFGQEVGVTALQLVGAFSALANQGRLMEPKVVDGIYSDQGEPLWRNAACPVRQVVSPETAQKAVDVLIQAVERGTGQNAQIQWDKNIKVAGKTGTAQKYDPTKRRYHESLTLISFCGFFPAQKPAFTILVILDEPSGTRWGGIDAAPVFRRIAEKLNSRIGV